MYLLCKLKNTSGLLLTFISSKNLINLQEIINWDQDSGTHSCVILFNKLSTLSFITYLFVESLGASPDSDQISGHSSNNQDENKPKPDVARVVRTELKQNINLEIKLSMAALCTKGYDMDPKRCFVYKYCSLLCGNENLKMTTKNYKVK